MNQFRTTGLKVSGIADLVELLRPILLRLSSNKLIQYPDKSNSHFKTVKVFQYWSQEERPIEISKAFKLWDNYLRNSSVLKIERFNKITAIDWLNHYAPEYQEVFKRAIHPAMEADIFRVAYASKKGGVWIDADHVPPKVTSKNIRHFNIQSMESWVQDEQSNFLMKHWRENTPYLNNSIFLSHKDCPLVRAMSERILSLDPAEFATASGISTFAGPKALTEEAEKILIQDKITVNINEYGQINILNSAGSMLFTISNLFKFLGARKEYADVFGGDSKWEYKRDSLMDWRSV
ncbi:capsular polysaccharide synthesis protein [Marinobacterium sp. YM272]|uniref:capsular polysaccharide synthesis protein n=1 Tax=Marinobacterium sp. YM272 TaxID=3421654 RepID=UPI003D7FFE17